MRPEPLAILLLALAAPALAQWRPADTPLLTRWADDVSPDDAWTEHPRPTLVRDAWISLNGLWDYNVATPDEQETDPASRGWDGKILVPFPIESALSGVGRRLAPDDILTYHREFSIPDDWADKRVLLHFDAVDWFMRAEVNAQQVGRHAGAYDRATFDITSALRADGPQTLRVVVRDPTDAGTQPRGKQVREPGGIWYTPASGIWQTVWLEALPRTAVEDVEFDVEMDTGDVLVTAHASRAADTPAAVAVLRNGRTVAEATGVCGDPIRLHVPAHKPWTPDDPAIYDVEISLNSGDRVRSYFAFREITVEPDDAGITRIHLNGEPTFLLGTLDQGYWPDGLYTPPTEEAMLYDLHVTKRLGFNTVRKHVKVEPQRWYAACDRLGLLVVQDMPSGDEYVRRGEGEIDRDASSAAQFEAELTEIVAQLDLHPSIVMWVPFNEGWGQYDTARIVEKIKLLDPTRLVDPASGWNDYPVGDVHDVHVYPGPGSPDPEPSRAAFLGEFGGLGLPVSGHTWQDEDNWGYRSFDSRGELTDEYVSLIDDLRWLVAEPGLSGAIYTQTTDVEIEVNGLMTYDRAVVKMDEQRVADANRRLLEPPPRVRTLVPTSRDEPHPWRYTTTDPGPGWSEPGFKDEAWSAGPAGFGRGGTPGASVRTSWTSADIWIRRTFTLPDRPLTSPAIRVHHDEDADVFINGVLAAKLRDYTTSYVIRDISPEAKRALRPGENTIAIHCRQTGGGQYIDAGIVDLVPLDD